MASAENYFVVRTGLGVGTQALYADSVTKTVAIGKTIASDNVTLDVVGDIRATERIFAETSLGVGTLDPQEELDVQGSAIIKDQFGVNTTNLENYTARFNNNVSESVYITGIGSVGIGVSNPLYELDVASDARISGFTSLTNSRIGFATIGVSTVGTSYVGILTVGFGSITASITGVGTINTAFIDTETVGFSSIASAEIVGARIGISTITFADINQELVGLSTVGIATINNAYAGILTAAQAFIAQESVGISTVGFASISNARIGFATVGFASITDALVGFATITQEVVGISSITNAYIGVSTIGIATIGIATIQTAIIGVATVGVLTAAQFVTGIATIGITTIGSEYVLDSTIENLRVIGVTTTGTLDVGIAGTILTASREFNSETVYKTDGITVEKTITPLVGIGTSLPTRTLDIAGDIRIQGELIDSENNVGFAYSVVGTKYNIPGRFLDAANLLVRNKEFIANEVVGFITSTDGPFGYYGPKFDYGDVGVATGRVKCRRDIGLIIDAIAFDISKGGNSKSVGAGLSYYSGVTLQYLDDSPVIPTGFSTGYVKQATLVGFSSVASLARYVINNVRIPKSYQVPPVSGKNADASRLILANKTLIAEVAVGRMLAAFSGFSVPGGNQNCIDDIVDVIEAICYNLELGGNDQVYDAAKIYIDNAYLAGEETESIYAFNEARNMAIQAMRNQTITLGGYTALTQVKDNAVVGDISGLPGVYNSGDCADVASAITTFFAIITDAISLDILPASRTITGIGSIPQLFDTELLPDGDSNTNPNGCANVVSAIYTCVGIVTTIIDNGPNVAPKINNPVGEIVWQPPGAKVGNEWFVAKYGNDSNLGESPGDAFLTIKKACSVAQPGDTVKVFAGIYVEDGPIQVPERVAVVGEDLRRTLVSTRGQTDLYHVRRGCYIAQQSFIGPSNPNAMVSFPTQGKGYADGTEQNWQSPYVQNCTNFVPDSVGMRIDGNRAGGFKSMVLDAYTQYNQGGIGVSITNFGYAQLVSLFTICCDIAVYNDTGGVCDMNNSNASFGNYGLWANGTTPLQYVGIVTVAPTGDNVDSLVLNVGAGRTQAYDDAVDLLRANADFLANEVVGFVTSTSGPYGAIGPTFDYGGAKNGREKCKRDTKIIVEALALDLLLQSNNNAIDTSLAYRDSPDYSLTYLSDSTPRPVGFVTGYVASGEIAAIAHLAGICTYVIQNQNLPVSYQSGISSITQVKDANKNGYTPTIGTLLRSNAGIITSVIGVGTGAIPARILPKGQRPYDGQVSFIGTQYFTVNSIRIDNPGFGYEVGAPVEVQIGLPNLGDDGIPAEVTIFEDGVGADGTIQEVSILVSGTGYLTPPTVTIAPPPVVGPGIGTTATATAVMQQLFFNVVSSTPVDPTGITTVTFDQFITYPVSVGASVNFFQASKIIASGITFEYIGTGTDIVNSIPSKGAVPIDDNQIVATNGGRVPFTSTDQGGNFRISEGITINQNTGTISGTAFSKSLQSEVTPLIIALGGG
jgi:hypothetical protein